MNTIKEKIITKDGLHLHLIPNKKFKTISFVAKFKAPLTRETITKRALLPYILRQGTKNYPTEQDLQLKLDELYGAVLSIDAAKKGNNHILSIRLDVANQKYIPETSDVIDESIQLLHDIIFQPRTEQNGFQKKVFERERETLRQKMRAIIDDKMMYANIRLIDEMCEGEAYQLHVHGYEEDLDKLTAEELYAYYTNLFKEDALDLYVLGDFDSELMAEKVTQTISKKSKQTIPVSEDEKIDLTEAPKVIIETDDIQQAKLHIGYRTHCTYKDDDYYALQVFNGLFGGFPSSKLFINVREKNSLAYYAASRIESHKGLLLVFSGIDANDYEDAREIIEQQMTAMKNGDFSLDELEETKDLVINQLLETIDNPRGIVELLYQQVLAGKRITPEVLIQNIKKVTKDDVVRVAKNIKTDTIYLLTNKDGDIDAKENI